MKGDFTRFTSDPEKHYTRVLEQQGRVHLDADHNEWVEILTHLERTEAIDVIGPCGAPESGGGFEIGMDGDQLTISRGRIYVDGILCSNEAEDRTDPVSLGNQPDLPGYEPALADDALYQVYLDVWERHITAVEDPELREVALGGPDTTTRTQVICQVKVARLERIRPPVSLTDLRCQPFQAPAVTGRLAARTEPGEEPSDPCVVPAQAGYRGLENRLYRVEIHEVPQTGRPTFKWSRDNGAVVFPVTEIDGKVVTVGTLGRDEVLTVRPGDWVEILGDETELYGRPGTLAEVQAIDRADREITLSADISAHAGEEHLKLRRWDGAGAQPVHGSWRDLEDGVQVRFDAGGTYQVGDYWVIPARTRQGSVLWPQETPSPPAMPKALPRFGITHHHCTLALARRAGGAWTEVRDCRPRFHPLTELDECCCTVVVRPGENIQWAIDSLPPEGGCVCLKVGLHRISEPIRIEGSGVVLRGESPGARVVRGQGVQLLDIFGALGEVSRITIQGIHFESGRAGQNPADALVTIEDARDVRLRECTLESPPARAAAAGPVGVRLVAENVEVSACRFVGLSRGVEAIGSSRLAVLANRMDGSASADTAIAVGTFRGDAHRVLGNHISGYPVGVQLGADDETHAGGRHSLIADNHIVRRGPAVGARETVYGIDVTATDSTIRGNQIELSPGLSGIRVSAFGARIEDNLLVNTERPGQRDELPVGIFVGLRSEEMDAPPDRALILHNRLEGLQHAILVAGRRELPIAGVRVLGNRIEGRSDERAVGIGLDRSIDGCVQDNQVRGTGHSVTLRGGRGNEVRGNRLLDGVNGIFAEEEEDLAVVGNVVEAMRRLGVGGARLEGTATIRECRVRNASYRALEGVKAVGVLVLNDLADRVELVIESCEVVDTGFSRNGREVHQPAVGIGALFVDSCRITDNLVTHPAVGEEMDQEAADLALLLLGRLHLRFPLSERLGLSLGSGSAQITGNKLVGPGSPHLVEIGVAQALRPEDNTEYLVGLTFERTIFSHNDVLHLLTPAAVEGETAGEGSEEEEPGKATIHFGLFDGVIQGNQVKAAFQSDGFDVSFGYPSMNFQRVGNITLLGNITTGPQVRLPRVAPINHRDFNIVHF